MLIITIGGGSTEWYDINKDKSMMVTGYKNKYALGYNIWYSPYDPNVIYTTNVEYRILSDVLGRKKEGHVFVMGIDLRSGELQYVMKILGKTACPGKN